MGCEPRTRLLCPLEGLGLGPGREEGWHDTASSFLLHSPLPLNLKEEGRPIRVSHPELKERTQFKFQAPWKVKGGHKNLEENLMKLNLQISVSYGDSRGQQGLCVLGPVGRDWEFRLCPESNGEPGVLIERSSRIRTAF